MQTEIKRLDTPNGRFYETPHGIFPSVTTVLSSLSSDSLDEWKKAVGDDVARKICENAARRGTRLHDYCEKYLKKEDLPKLDIFDREEFKGIEKTLDLIKPIAIEKFVYSPILKVAGSLDCFCKFSGKICVLDFKTASREKFDGEFDSYWMQTAAYAQCLYDQYGIEVEDLCIVMQFEGTTKIFWSKKSLWIEKFREVRNQFE